MSFDILPPEWYSMTAIRSRLAQAQTDYQESVCKLVYCLAGDLRLAQVETAVRASGIHPNTLYEIASAGKPLPESFRETLYGPSAPTGGTQ